jgi:hypothetical protein
MTDKEIKKYLKANNYKVLANEAVSKILNTSCQILNYEYDFDTGMMRLQTENNIFTFEWILGNPLESKKEIEKENIL